MKNNTPFKGNMFDLLISPYIFISQEYQWGRIEVFDTRNMTRKLDSLDTLTILVMTTFCMNILHETR